MPELPEVEIICRYLRDHVLYKTIVKVDNLLPRMWRNVPATIAAQALVGESFTSLTRRGKYIHIEVSDGSVLIVHLKMTGRLIYHDSLAQPDRFDRVIFEFEDSQLSYGDVRTLGALYWFPSEEAIDNKGYLALGVEPLSDDFTPTGLYQMAKTSGRALKTFLLDQKYVAGLGNIYVDEALYRAGIRPTRRAHTLKKKEAQALYESIRYVLTNSLASGGTSFRDYRNGEGKQGHNQDNLQVYSRKGKPCFQCNQPLEGTIIGGRSTVYCKHCQH